MVTLPRSDYDVVGSIVLFDTPFAEIEKSVQQFLAVPLKTHLVIVDNSARPCALPPLDVTRVTYHFAAENLGYGRGHNIALNAARGHSRYSLVMNTDIDYSPDVVLRLKQVLDERTNAGLAAPKILNPDGSLQYVCRLLPTPLNFFLRRFLPKSKWGRDADYEYELRWWDHSCMANLPYFQGSFILLRTNLCAELGGFDERFFLYGEDIDLTRRLHQVSETLYVPDARIIHKYRRLSNRGLAGTWIGIQNNARYLNKWGWFFDESRRLVNRQAVDRLRQACPGNPPATSSVGKSRVGK